MPKVHFIYYGPVPTEDADIKAFRPANQLARQCPGAEVYYWVKSDHSRDFKAQLDGKIKIRHCDTIREVLRRDPTLRNSDERVWSVLDQCLEKLIEVRAFAAVKDLLAQVILYSRGGYFFDTTCLVPPDDIRMRFSMAAISALPASFDKVYFPRLNGSVKYVPSMYSLDLLRYGNSMYSYVSGVNGKDVFLNTNIEVWAGYAPPEHATTKSILTLYAAQAKGVGLLDGEALEMLKAGIGQSPVEGPGKTRNTIIGNLVVRPVLDGLMGQAIGAGAAVPRTYKDSDAWTAMLASSLWDTTKTMVSGNEERWAKGDVVVPSLGIAKRYGQTWRAVKK